MPDYNQMLYDIEVHSVEGIRRYFDEGGDPNEVHNGMPLFKTMVEMYLRSPRFKECIKVFIDKGLVFEEQALLAVLIDDAGKLAELVKADRSLIRKTYDLFNNAFTPLTGGTLFHFCAEYNRLACPGILFKYGPDVNAKPAIYDP